LRQFLAIDAQEPFITPAQTTSGQLLIVLTATLALAPHLGNWAAALAAGAAMAAAIRPNLRGPILFAATWATAFIGTALGENDTLDNIVAVIQQEQVIDLSPVALATGFLLLFTIAVSGVLYWVHRVPQSVLARRPLVTLLALEALLCGFASLDLMQGHSKVILWAAIFVLTPYLWFLPYAIVDVRSRGASSPLMQLAVLRPFWSPTYLPFGKGAAFLRRHLAQTPRDLAITQLKAVKLLLWANVLFALRDGLSWVFEAQMQIPRVAQALDAFLGGQPYPLLTGWAAMILSTAKFSLKVAGWAHLFIGIARLAGYRLPRGSWRPLESRTLMDYFNRFHYYFKELLVDFFFIPTFFKMFRKHPRLRMFFATFMAAGVGNAIWHLTRDIQLIATLGPAAALEAYTSYAFYCVVLATGVGLSQVRASMGIRPSATPIGRLYSFLFVWSFVVCMHVFSDESHNHTLSERLSFLASLFGVF
jgi:D-alanyl-lipoteichoic acid acyltransferase DltB (MBOAT superfamily)